MRLKGLARYVKLAYTLDTIVGEEKRDGMEQKNIISPSSKISKDVLLELRRLCLTSIEIAIKRLCEAGSWPRPSRARVMRLGIDFYSEDIHDIQEVHDLVELLASQEFIKNTYLREQKDKYILNNYWTRLLVNVLADTEGVTLSLPIFNKWFKNYINELYTNTSVWRIIEILDGLVLDSKNFRLNKHSILLPIPGTPWDWLESLVPKHDKCFNSYEFIDKELKGSFDITKASILVTTLRIPKSEYKGLYWPNSIHNNSHGSALVASIRLAKPGSFYLRSGCIFQLSNLPFSEPLAYNLRDFLSGLRVYEKDTIISNNDFRNIRTIWQELMNTVYKRPIISRGEDNSIEIARGRFFNSYNTTGWYQNILDLTIALEALFSPSDSQEISHRIALRCAWLIETNSKNDTHKGTYTRVRAMYDLRSHIVHGDSPKDKDISKWIAAISGIKYEPSRDWELRELAIEEARHIVRKALRACNILSKLSQSLDSPCWPLPKNFDQNIIIPNQQKIWQRAAGILS